MSLVIPSETPIQSPNLSPLANGFSAQLTPNGSQDLRRGNSKSFGGNSDTLLFANSSYNLKSNTNRTSHSAKTPREKSNSILGNRFKCPLFGDLPSDFKVEFRQLDTILSNYKSLNSNDSKLEKLVVAINSFNDLFINAIDLNPFKARNILDRLQFKSFIKLCQDIFEEIKSSI